jgi:RNA polymerase sigma factor (sigma-70 family)
MKYEKPGWARINELAYRYLKLIDCKPEIYYKKDKETGEKKLVDYRKPEQIKIANEVISGMIPFIRGKANEILNGYVEIVGKKISKQYARNRVTVDDLVGIGAIGIMKALTRFDKERNKDFVNCASYSVSAEISKYIETNCNSVYVPRHVYEMSASILKKVNTRNEQGEMFTIMDAKKKIAGNINPKKGEGTAEEIANMIIFSIKGSYFEFSQKVRSKDNEGKTYQDLVLSDGSSEERIVEILEKSFLEKQISRVLATLPPKDEDVLRKRFFEGKELQEIADKYGCTQTNISYIQKKALKKLSKLPRRKWLEELIEE